MFLYKNSLVTKGAEVKIVFPVKLPVFSTNKARRMTLFRLYRTCKWTGVQQRSCLVRSHAAGSTLSREVISELPDIRVALPEAPVCLFLLSHLAATEKHRFFN